MKSRARTLQQTGTFSETSEPIAAAPTATPGSSQFTAAQNVTVSSATSGATIYYTLDGSTPTTGSASVASGGTIAITQSSTVLGMFAAASGYGNSAVATYVYLIVPPPTAPSNLVATAVPDGVDLSWTDNGSSATSITVQQSTDGGTTWTTVATLSSSATSYAATGLDPTQSYTYQVSASNSSGTATSGASSATQPEPAIPASPTGLTGVIDGSGNMNLTWTASTGATSYLVERETLATGVWSTLAAAVTGTTYQDTGYGAGGYHYRISATNATGTSSPSTEYPISCYAVIDLGANIYPKKITNSGYVLCHGSTSDAVVTGFDNNADFYTQNSVWSNGTMLALQPLDPTTSGWGPSDIGEDGTVVGVENVYSSAEATDTNFYWDPCNLNSGGSGEYGDIGNLAVWLPGSPNPTLTAPPIFTFNVPNYGILGVGGYESYTDGASEGDGDGTLDLPPYISPGNGSGPIIWSVQVTPSSTLGDTFIDGFKGPIELGSIAPGLTYNNLQGTRVYPLAVNTSNQCLEQNNFYSVTSQTTGPISITYTLGSSTLPAGFWPIGGQGTLSNVNALGTTYVLGVSRTNYSSVVWDGTNTITLPGGGAAVNAATTTITGANGAPQTVPATQVVGDSYYGNDWQYNGHIMNMIPSTSGPPTFGNPQALDDLLPANTPWSGIYFKNDWDVTSAWINDSGAICALGTYTPTSSTDTTPAGVHGLVLLPIAFTPQQVPITGVVRASLKFGSGFQVPTIDPAHPPTITIGGQPATDVRQDDEDPHILYFTPPPSPTQVAGEFDLVISGINIPGMPCLSANQPLTLPNFVTYTSDATDGVNGFSDAIGVSIAESQSMDEKQSATGQLFMDRMEHQVNLGMSLMKQFSAITDLSNVPFDNLMTQNNNKTTAALTNLGYVGGNGGGIPSGVTVLANPNNAYVNPLTSAQFTVTRPTSASTPLTVYYTISGTAVSGTDFVPLSGSVTIPANQVSTTIAVTPISTSSITTSGTVIMSITPNTAYSIGFYDTATATIYSSGTTCNGSPGNFFFAGSIMNRPIIMLMPFTQTSPPALPSPIFGSATFFQDVKTWLQITGNSVYVGSYGPSIFAVVNADNFELTTQTYATAGKTIDNAVSDNPSGKLIFNGALFNWHNAEPLITTGKAYNNGTLQPTSNTGEPSEVASSLRYWFGQTTDYSATTNAGQALTYQTGGKGDPSGLRAAIGGLTSLILNKTAITSGSGPGKDTDLDTYTGMLGPIHGQETLSINRQSGMIIVTSSTNKIFQASQSIFDIQSKLLSSGVDQSLVCDGGGSVGLAVNGKVLLRGGRQSSPSAADTVTSYFIFNLLPPAH